MSYDWRDKVVLITGAANGIGACVVRLALEEGAKKGDTFERTGVRISTVINGITATPRCDAEITLKRGETPEVKYVQLMTNMQFQKTESAATGLIEAYKRGENGSTRGSPTGTYQCGSAGNIAQAFSALGEYN